MKREALKRGTAKRLTMTVALLAGVLASCSQGTVPQNAGPQNAGARNTGTNTSSSTAFPTSQTLVVGLSDPAQANALALRVGGTLLSELPALNAVLIGLNSPRPDPQAAALALNGVPGVTFAAAQSVLTRDPLESARTPELNTQAVNQTIDALPQYSLDAGHLNAQAAWKAGLRGGGVTVGLLDAPADLTHPDLRAQWAGRAYDPATDSEYTSANAWAGAVRTMAGGDPSGIGGLDSGTATASAAVGAQNGAGMVGVAPDARFLTAAVFQPAFVGSFDAARALVWTVNAGAKVIDLPWSSLGYDPLLKAATDYALSRGVTVVAAAGNGGRQERQQPAMYPGVLASAAGDLSGSRASFSSYGPGPSPLVPGTDLLLAKPGWNNAAGTFALYSGTSFSSALLAGGAALLLGADGTLDPYQVRSLLLQAVGDTSGPLDLGRLPALLAAPRPQAAATAHLSLRVHTDSGDVPALLGDLTLLSTDPAGPVYLAQTDAAGNADFYGLQPGSYHVVAAAPDLSVTGGQADERGSLSADLTLLPGAATTQTYTLSRGAVNLNPSDPYEPNDDPASAAPIGYGTQTALAYIFGKPRDLDFYAFQGSAGDRIRLSVAAKGDPAVGGQLDSVLVLRDPSGTIIGYDDDYTGPDARLEATLPTAGRYTAEVSSFQILGPSEGADPSQGQPDDSPFNRYRLRLDLLNSAP